MFCSPRGTKSDESWDALPRKGQIILHVCQFGAVESDLKGIWDHGMRKCSFRGVRIAFFCLVDSVGLYAQ